jgi:hypothetical protein
MSFAAHLSIPNVPTSRRVTVALGGISRKKESSIPVTMADKDMPTARYAVCRRSREVCAAASTGNTRSAHTSSKPTTGNEAVTVSEMSSTSPRSTYRTGIPWAAA